MHSRRGRNGVRTVGEDGGCEGLARTNGVGQIECTCDGWRRPRLGRVDTGPSLHSTIAHR